MWLHPNIILINAAITITISIHIYHFIIFSFIGYSWFWSEKVIFSLSAVFRFRLLFAHSALHIMYTVVCRRTVHGELSADCAGWAVGGGALPDALLFAPVGDD